MQNLLIQILKIIKFVIPISLVYTVSKFLNYALNFGEGPHVGMMVKVSCPETFGYSVVQP